MAFNSFLLVLLWTIVLQSKVIWGGVVAADTQIGVARGADLTDSATQNAQNSYQKEVVENFVNHWFEKETLDSGHNAQLMSIENLNLSSFDMRLSVDFFWALKNSIGKMRDRSFKSIRLKMQEFTSEVKTFISEQFGQQAKDEISKHFHAIQLARTIPNAGNTQNADCIKNIESFLDWWTVAVLYKDEIQFVLKYQLNIIFDYLDKKFDSDEDTEVKTQRWHQIFWYNNRFFEDYMGKYIMEWIINCSTGKPGKQQSCSDIVANAQIVVWNEQTKHIGTAMINEAIKKMYNNWVDIVFNAIGYAEQVKEKIPAAVEWHYSMYVLQAIARTSINLGAGSKYIIERGEDHWHLVLKLMKEVLLTSGKLNAMQVLGLDICDAYVLSLCHDASTNTEYIVMLQNLFDRVAKFSENNFIDPVFQRMLVGIHIATSENLKIFKGHQQLLADFLVTSEMMKEIYENVQIPHSIGDTYAPSFMENILTSVGPKRRIEIKKFYLVVLNSRAPSFTDISWGHNEQGILNTQTIQLIAQTHQLIASAGENILDKEIRSMLASESLSKELAVYNQFLRTKNILNFQNKDLAIYLIQVQEILAQHASDNSLQSTALAKMISLQNAVPTAHAEGTKILTFAIQYGFGALGDIIDKFGDKFSGTQFQKLHNYIEGFRPNWTLLKQEKAKETYDNYDLLLSDAMKQIYTFYGSNGQHHLKNETAQTEAIRYFYIMITNIKPYMISVVTKYQAAKLHTILQNFVNHLPNNIATLIEGDLTTEIITNYFDDSTRYFTGISSNNVNGYRFGTFKPNFQVYQTNEINVGKSLLLVQNMIRDPQKKDQLISTVEELVRNLNICDSSMTSISYILQYSIRDLPIALESVQYDHGGMQVYYDRAIFTTSKMDEILKDYKANKSQIEIVSPIINRIFEEGPGKNDNNIKHLYLAIEEFNKRGTNDFNDIHIEKHLWILDMILQEYAKASDEWLWIRIKDAKMLHNLRTFFENEMTNEWLNTMGERVNTFYSSIATISTDENHICNKWGMLFGEILALIRNSIDISRSSAQYFRNNPAVVTKLSHINSRLSRICQHNSFAMNQELRKDLTTFQTSK